MHLYTYPTLRPIHLTIKSLFEPTFLTVQVYPNWTVEYLNIFLRAYTEYRNATLRENIQPYPRGRTFIYDKQLLSANQTLDSAGIQDGSTIYGK